MTPEQLKASILQYAIQGKLVEQRPEEGTAEELYQQIQEEKQKLIKAGKIKKEKPLAEITEDEIPFDIPESWKWVRWGNLSQRIQYGFNAPAQLKGRIKMVRISDIQNEKVMWNTVPYCDILEEEIGTYLLKENDILFARTGGTVGKSFLVNTVPEDAIYAGYLIRSSYSEKICPKYIKFFMGTKLYWDQLRNGTIATAQPNCNGQTLSKMMLPLPPLEEQQRIVAKIEELLPYVDRYAEAYEKLERFNAKFQEDMKKSILQYAIQGKLVEQRPEEGTAEELYQQIVKDRDYKIKTGLYKKDRRSSLEGIEVEKPFDIPETWKWVTLGSILLKLTDGTHKTPKYAENGVKFVSVKDISSGQLSLDNTKFITKEEHDELYKRCDPERGDMLLSKVGTTGVPAIVNTDEEFSLFVSVALLKFNSELINTKYLYYLLYSPLVQQQAADNTRGVGNKNWVLDAIGKTLITLPPLEEQYRIVAKIEELLPFCEQLTK